MPVNMRDEITKLFTCCIHLCWIMQCITIYVTSMINVHPGKKPTLIFTCHRIESEILLLLPGFYMSTQGREWEMQYCICSLWHNICKDRNTLLFKISFCTLYSNLYYGEKLKSNYKLFYAFHQSENVWIEQMKQIGGYVCMLVVIND